MKRKHEKEGKEFSITYEGLCNYLWKKRIKLTTIHGEVIEFNILTGTLGYSRLHTLVYSETRTTEDLIRCLLETIRKLGGVPKTILTDNMSSIVSIQNNRRMKHPKILQLEKDLGLEIKL